MGFILFLAVLYILKAAVIMLDRKSLIEKSQSFNISYHLPEAEMNSTPADAGVFFVSLQIKSQIKSQVEIDGISGILKRVNWKYFKKATGTRWPKNHFVNSGLFTFC